METVATLIVTALVNGIVNEVAKDSYSKLKELILRRYGKISIAQLEEAPQSKARQAVVEEDLRRAGADQDQEVLALAKLLLDVLQGANGNAMAPDVKGTGSPENLIEMAERRAGSQAIGQIMEKHVQTVMAARDRYPLKDFDLLSLRLANNLDVPQSIRTEVGRLHSKVRLIIEEVATRIEERKYRSSEIEIESMPLAFADRQKARELVKADKHAHISYQALKVTVELFSDLNQMIVEKINHGGSLRSQANLILGNAVLVYELTDFVIHFIEGFVVQGIPEIVRLHEETKKKISEQRRHEEQLRKTVEGDNIMALNSTFYTSGA